MVGFDDLPDEINAARDGLQDGFAGVDSCCQSFGEKGFDLGFSRVQPLWRPRQYISGESHYYLGKQYVLKVTEHPTEKPSVKLLRGKIEVTVREKSAEKISALLADWYKARAKEVFARRLEAMLEQALWGSEKPPLRVLTMQTQWGSYSPAGRLTLNPHLVKAARDCIDYVIVHELCHLAEHNHSERFYRLIGQVMPNWEKVKGRLDGIANALLNLDTNTF